MKAVSQSALGRARRRYGCWRVALSFHDRRRHALRGCPTAGELCDRSGNCPCNSPHRVGSTSGGNDRRRTTSPCRFTQTRSRATDSPRMELKNPRFSSQREYEFSSFSRQLNRMKALCSIQVRVAWSDDRRGCDGDLERVEVVARQIPGRSRQTTSGRSSGRSYVVGAEKASILYSRQELAERLRLAWKHREENRANIDIFLAHGFAVEERCDSELSTPATPLPKEPDSIYCHEKTLNWNIGERVKPSDPVESRDGSSENRGKEIEHEIDNDELEAASKTTKDDSMTRKSEEENAKKEREEFVVNTNVEEKRKTRISIDCTSLHSLNFSTASFTSLNPESTPAKVASDDFSSAKQKRASFHSGTNRAFLVPMIEKPAKGPTETSKSPTTDKVIPIKSFEIKSTDKTAAQKQTTTTTTTDTRSPIALDKNVVLTKGSSMISLDKTRRTNSAPPQRRGGGGNITPAARVQVNIVIDAPSVAEATSDKPIVCGLQAGKNTVEKSEESSAKVRKTRMLKGCRTR